MGSFFSDFSHLYPFKPAMLWIWWLVPFATSAMLWLLLSSMNILSRPYMGAVALLPLLFYIRLYSMRRDSLSFWPGTIAFLMFAGVLIAIGGDVMTMAHLNIGLIESRSGHVVAMPFFWLAIVYMSAVAVVSFIPIEHGTKDEGDKHTRRKNN